jgi:hypothetical protein
LDRLPAANFRHPAHWVSAIVAIYWKTVRARAVRGLQPGERTVEVGVDLHDHWDDFVAGQAGSATYGTMVTPNTNASSARRVYAWVLPGSEELSGRIWLRRAARVRSAASQHSLKPSGSALLVDT